MDSGIMIGSECADWWDEQLKDYKEELEAYVLENPSNFGIAIATVKASGADLAHLFIVDLLRLGEGFAEGTVSGVVRDIFRVLTFIPQTKITQATKAIPGGLYGRAVQTLSNLFRWSHLDGGLCVPITIAQALQRTGQRLVLSMQAIAKAAKIELSAIEASGLAPGKIAGVLTELGAEFTQVANATVSSFDDVIRLAQRSEGSVMVGLRGFRNGVEEFHRILVGKTVAGVKIIDRSGAAGSLDELAGRYQMDALWQLNLESPMFVIENAVIDLSNLALVKSFGILACLSRMSFGVFDFNRAETTAEFVKQQFAEFVAKRHGRKPPVQLGDIVIEGGKTITVQAGDPTRSTLSGISKDQYGTFDLWPLVYDLNHEVIGKNPNKLKTGQELLVLPLERYSAAEIAEAKRRAPSWKNYK